MKLHESQPFLKSQHGLKESRICPHFRKPGDSQKPTTNPYPQPNKSSHTLPFYFFKSTLILSSHVRLDTPSSLFRSGFPTKLQHAFPFTLISATHPALHILIDLIACTTFGKLIQIVKLLITQFHPVSCHFLPLRSKYLNSVPSSLGTALPPSSGSNQSRWTADPEYQNTPIIGNICQYFAGDTA